MKTIRYFLDNFERLVSIALMSIMTVILAIQVFMRYVMNNSLSWSEEMARYIFVWLIYISISYGAQSIKHIKIDAAMALFPAKWRRWVAILGDVLFLLFCLFIVWTAWGIIGRQLKLGQYSPAMQMPMWILYAAPMVGFGLTAIREVQTIYRRLTDPDMDV